MQKTSNYNLNKPEVTDPLRVADFNENANIIDAALGELRGTGVRVGSYEGTGTNTRTLELEFTPRAIILISQLNEEGRVGFNFATADFGCFLNTTATGINGTRCVKGGVYLATPTNNSTTYLNHYIAFV